MKLQRFLLDKTPVVVCMLCAFLVAVTFQVVAQEKSTKEKRVEGKDAEGKKDEKGENDEDEYALYRLLINSVDQIERKYVDKVDRRKLIEAAIDGMIKELDQYSDYIPPSELERFKTGVEQEFGGIGIQVSVEGDYLTVISPIFGSPAYKAGIIAGDQVLKINSVNAKGITFDDAVKLIKGKIGTTVNVTVKHKASGETETFDVERQIIQLQTVLGYELQENDNWNYFCNQKEKIGYIRLTSFARHSATDLEKALRGLQKAGMKSLVLDLRFNPGGLLPVAIEICDLFVKQGRIVGTKGRTVRNRQWYAKEKGTYSDFPITILINEYSASASEIVAACLKDNGRATIVGERSFGKGSVQNLIELENGKSILKLTTSGYFRPNGKNIHRSKDSKPEDEWGVKPSTGFAIEMNDEADAEYLKLRRELDIMGGKSSKTTEKVEAEEARESRSTDSLADPQLKKAMDYLLSENTNSN